jgi:hypothetical protein
MRFDETFADGQTEPSSTDSARHFAAHAVEPIEDSIELCHGQTKPLVRD